MRVSVCVHVRACVCVCTLASVTRRGGTSSPVIPSAVSVVPINVMNCTGVTGRKDHVVGVKVANCSASRACMSGKILLVTCTA